MIKKIINLLRQNRTLMNMIDGTAEDAHIYPIQTAYTGNCIVYDAYTTAHDKITQEVRLQITIIADTLAQTLEIEQEVEKTLLTFGDTPLKDNILQVSANGGGSLYDTARRKNHRYIYFNILSRSEI